MAKLKITETVLRDAHQSLLATRMSMDDMREILPEIDKIGFYSAECWGGATFDSCIRFLNEDPWERLRILRKEMPNTKLQMLFRGQNMLGYRHYADDLVEYTHGEVFTHEYYINYAKQIENAGADSICIKDMAARLTPYEAETLVKDLKSAVKIPIQLHTHYTSGLASMCILKAVEAGVDGVDTAMSPLALGTSHAPTESIVATFKGTEYDTGLDLVKLNVIRDYFMKLRKKYIDNGLLDPSMLATNTNALLYQVPGGMLSNLLSQLKQAGKADQLDDVLKEVPKVRKDAGYPPLVTPTSQIVGTQAVFNVIMGERYKTVTKEFKGLVKGEYGKTPVAIDPEFQKKILGDEEPITCRPADLLQPEFETMKKEAAEWTEQEEDILTYAMFPKVAPKFFKDRRDRKYGVDGKHSDAENKVHPV